jgi:hypothetical protein
MIIISYIARFYLYKNEFPQRFVGVIEEVGKKGRKAFSSYEELWEIFSSSAFPRSSSQGTKKVEKNLTKRGDKILKG